MNDLTASIQEIVRKTYQKDTIDIEFSRPSRPEFGDYSTSFCFSLAKEIGVAPHIIANKIVTELQDNKPECLLNASVAGGGYINITFTNDFLFNLLKQPTPKLYMGKTVVVETNNPNPFKDIHIGHAMNAIVADTIANIIEASGAKLHRVSYHGDVGLHVAKSLWAMQKSYGENIIEQLSKIPENERPNYLKTWYADGSKAYETDESAKKAIEKLIPETFSTDNKTISDVYSITKQWSFDYFDSIFKTIGNKPVERRYLESEADKIGREAVENHIGDIFIKSDGAIIFPGEQFGLHNRVFIASRGTTLYESRDLGLILLKAKDYNPDKSYIVTAEEQKEYFRVVLKAASLVLTDHAQVTENISTGTVKLTTGKMSSRTGGAVNISWLLDNLNDSAKNLNNDPRIIDMVTVGALRYTFLKNRLTSDTVFDIKQAISIDGNTGPYLQYAYARAFSVIKKSSYSEVNIIIDDIEPEERYLLSKFTEFNIVFERAAKELMPHHISNYLFELCKDFNSFYESNRIIGHEREENRIAIVKSYIKILEHGLSLLGIPAPESM